VAGLDHVRFHDGRHTALTRLAEKGQPDWVIQAQMGHVSPAMMRTYSHIRRKALDEAAAALEPSFELVFPPDPRGLKPTIYMDVDSAKDVDDAKNVTSRGRCDRLMSQFTSQWDDRRKKIALPRTAPPKAARPSGARARETASQTEGIKRGVAPRAGLEPATLRLTEDGGGSDGDRPSAIKWLRRLDFWPLHHCPSQSVDQRHNRRFSRGYVTVHVTAFRRRVDRRTLAVWK
jgi:hypothetical protein